ncbi:MAG: hypothetical protein V3R57_06695 [Candidatus Bathyarchaeia archaeon]
MAALFRKKMGKETGDISTWGRVRTSLTLLPLKSEVSPVASPSVTLKP